MLNKESNEVVHDPPHLEVNASGYKTRWLLAWISLKFLAKFLFYLLLN